MSIQWDSSYVQFAIAIVLAILAWSIPSIGVIWRCILWFAAWVFVLHLTFSFTPLSTLPRFAKLMLSVGVTALLTAVLYGAVVALWKEEKAAVHDGKLVAELSLDGVDGDYRLQIGKSGTCFESSLPTPFDMVGDKLKFGKHDGKLTFSTTVRDRSGNLVVEIKDNMWHVGTSSWDKNYTRDSLEVLDGRGKVVFQMRLFTNGIQIQGEWNDESGAGVQLVQTDKTNSALIRFELSNQAVVKPIEIERIFAYPSKKHFGRLLVPQPFQQESTLPS